MKIRIGLGFGAWSFQGRELEAVLEFVDLCESLDIDSLWFSDRIVSPNVTLEPIVLMSYVASRVRNMKLGTSVLVLPTRNPVLLAKQLATLDVLCRGRLLLAVGLGSDESRDFEVTGVRKQERGERTDEAIVLMRELWSRERVDFKGTFHEVRSLTLLPRPYQTGGPPIWVGGRSRAALRRAGHLADGWLVSSATPAEVETGINAVRRYAAAAGRKVPEDHYGVVLPFFFAPTRDQAWELVKSTIRSQREIPAYDYCALGTPDMARERIREYTNAGASKFVMRPCGPKESLYEQIRILAREVIQPFQTPFNEGERRERLGQG